jgi:hypothetical protein
LTRWCLLNQADLKAVESARAFHNLTKARYDAGQVTGMDVANAAFTLRTSELELLKCNSKLAVAKTRLASLAPGEIDAAIKSANAASFTIEKPGYATEIRSDEKSGSVFAITRKSGEKEPRATTPLFQALRVQDSEVTRLLNQTAPLEHARIEQESRALLAAMQELEAEMLLEGDRVEFARSAAESANISFERGLQSSFDVIEATERLLRAESEFIERRAEYEVQFATMESLLGGAVKVSTPEAPAIHTRTDGF